MTLTLLTLNDRLETRENCRLFLQAWQKWRGGKVLPLRSDVRPEDLKAAMAAVSVWELKGDGKVMVRLGATLFEEQTGETRRGKNYLDLMPERIREQGMERLQPIVRVPCGIFADGCSLRLKDGRSLEFDILLLPVAEAPEQKPTFIYYGIDLADRAKPFDISEIDKGPFVTSTTHIDIGCGVPEP